jgi:isopenicillin-N epimerase
MLSDSGQEIRTQFLLDPGVTFLNHGSFGATPRPVLAAAQRWQAEMERQPVEFLGRRFPELMRTAREALGQFIGSPSDALVFVPNATTGLNIVARSLCLGAGDEVLATNQEYGALDRTWKFLAGKQGFKYINTRLSLPPRSRQAWVEEFWSAVTLATRVIFVSHITSPTAAIFPVEEICRRARAAGILTVIDGAHAPGQIPLDLTDLDCDFYAGNLHKWLCAPKGSAFLYAHPRAQALIEPLVVSWGYLPEKPGPSAFIDLLEWSGTHDLSAYLAIPEAIRFQHEHDWDKVRRDCHRLAADTAARIQSLTGLPALYPPEPGWFGQMVAVELPATDPDALKLWLYEKWQIEVPVIRWENRIFLRISFQAYNNLADADRLLDALRDAFCLPA